MSKDQRLKQKKDKKRAKNKQRKLRKQAKKTSALQKRLKAARATKVDERWTEPVEDEGSCHPVTIHPRPIPELAEESLHAARTTVLPDFIREKTERVYPIPEIFPDGRGWKIVNSEHASGVDFAKKVVYTPLSNDDVSHCCKMQQMARIKWDDPSIHTEETLLFRALEDHRLSYLLAEHAKVDIRAGFFTTETTMLLMQHFGTTAGKLSVLLMTDYTNYAPTEELLAERDEAIILFKKVREKVRANPTKANTCEIIRWLRFVVQDEPQPQWMKVKIRGIPGDPGGNVSFEEWFDMAWDELDDDDKLIDIPASVREQLPEDMPESVAARIPSSMQNLGFTPWGAMRVEEPHRSQTIFGKFHRKWKPTEEGVFPRYPHRFFVDQRIFGRRYKIPGGTVVIDSSGSMELTPKAIQMIVEYAPGCVVANYSGTDSQGVLRILAKGSMRVINELCVAPLGRGNIVDFPALKWAYKQQHPRIWISDLGVTGIGDLLDGGGNLAMCAAVVKKGRFFHAPHVDQAINILKKLGRYYKK